MAKESPGMLATLYGLARTYPIEESGGGVDVIFTPQAGKRFVCLHMHLHCHGAADSVIVQSKPAGAAVDLTGDLGFDAHLDMMDLKNSGFPVFVGDDIDDALQITHTGANDVYGFAVVAEIDV